MPHMEALRELSLDDNELESEGAVFVAQGVKVRNILIVYLPFCASLPFFFFCLFMPENPFQCLVFYPSH